jgi:acetyl esterase/lipase
MEASGEDRITATLAGAGAYTKTAFSKAIIGLNKPLEFIANYLWVLHTYNRIYSTLKRPWSDYVNVPYAQHLEALQTITSSTIDQLIDKGKVETNPKKLFKESLISGINNGSDTALLNAFADNDLLDWTPKAPVFLYHGTEDDFVFPLNSSITAQALNAKGGKVSYVLLEGKDHATAVLDYFSNCITKIYE